MTTTCCSTRILDSVSCTGAYEFLISPGATTVAEVEAVVYFRDAGKHCWRPTRSASRWQRSALRR